jgi:hypothetical protein
VEDHGRAVTANPRAAAWYRQAQRAADPGGAAVALRLAIEADPGFDLAVADLVAMAGIPNDCTWRSQMSWERHHLEVIRASAIGDTRRAIDLLREHLAGVGCDPLAFRIAARFGHSTAAEDYSDLTAQLPDCHPARWSRRA